MEDEFEGDPQLISELKHDGDVLDLQVSKVMLFYLIQYMASKYTMWLHGCSVFVKFLDQDKIVTASSSGAVTIYRHHHTNQV